jgi:hypothetical protein
VWLAFGLLATGASLLPGRIGQLGRSAAAVTPPAIRRIVLAATGAAILVAPVASYADAPAASSQAPSQVRTSAAANPPTDPPASAQPAVTEPALTWPTDPPASDSPSGDPIGASTPTSTTTAAAPVPISTAGQDAMPGSPTLSVQNPVTAATSRAAPGASEVPRPSSTTAPTAAGIPTSPRPAPTVPAPAPARTPRQSKAVGTDDVTVGSGDSLWLITAHRLGAGASGARIAAEWPRWYAANRTAIGADPDLIQPGTRLQPPAARTTAATTTEE